MTSEVDMNEWQREMAFRNRMRSIDDILEGGVNTDPANLDIVTNSDPVGDTTPDPRPPKTNSIPPDTTLSTPSDRQTANHQSSSEPSTNGRHRASKRSLFGRRPRPDGSCPAVLSRSEDSQHSTVRRNSDFDDDEARRTNFWSSLGCGVAGKRSTSKKSKRKSSGSSESNVDGGSTVGGTEPQSTSSACSPISGSRPRMSSLSTDVDEAYHSGLSSTLSTPRTGSSTDKSAVEESGRRDIDEQTNDGPWRLNGVRLSSVVQRLMSVCVSPDIRGRRRHGQSSMTDDESGFEVDRSGTTRTSKPLTCNISSVESPAVMRDKNRSAGVVTNGQQDGGSPRSDVRRSWKLSRTYELGSIPENLPAAVQYPSIDRLKQTHVIADLGQRDLVGVVSRSDVEQSARLKDDVGRHVTSLTNQRLPDDNRDVRPLSNSPDCSVHSRFDPAGPSLAVDDFNKHGPQERTGDVIESSSVRSNISKNLDPDLQDVVRSDLRIVEPGGHRRTSTPNPRDSSRTFKQSSMLTRARAARRLDAIELNIYRARTSRPSTSTTTSTPNTSSTRQPVRAGSRSSVDAIKTSRSEELLTDDVLSSSTAPSRHRRMNSDEMSADKDGLAWRWVRCSRSAERIGQRSGSSSPCRAEVRGQSPIRRRALSREFKVVVVTTQEELTTIRPRTMPNDDTPQAVGSQPGRSSAQLTDCRVEGCAVDRLPVEQEQIRIPGEYKKNLSLITTTLSSMVQNLQEDKIDEVLQTSSVTSRSPVLTSPVPELAADSSVVSAEPEVDESETDMDELIASLLGIAGHDRRATVEDDAGRKAIIADDNTTSVPVSGSGTTTVHVVDESGAAFEILSPADVRSSTEAEIPAETMYCECSSDEDAAQATVATGDANMFEDVPSPEVTSPEDPQMIVSESVADVCETSPDEQADTDELDDVLLLIDEDKWHNDDTTGSRQPASNDDVIQLTSGLDVTVDDVLPTTSSAATSDAMSSGVVCRPDLALTQSNTVVRHPEVLDTARDVTAGQVVEPSVSSQQVTHRRTTAADVVTHEWNNRPEVTSPAARGDVDVYTEKAFLESLATSLGVSVSSMARN